MTGGLLGAVLAGGSSRRLGRDKAAAEVAGLRMIDRAVAALGPHCAEIVVISSRPDTPEGPWPRLPDHRSGAGPLAGIETALRAAADGGRDGAFVLACDLPLVDADVVGSIAGGLQGVEAVAAARDGDGPDFEPLCALYATSCLPVVSRLLDEGARAAGDLFRAVDGRRVDVGRTAALNVNREVDLVRARRTLYGGEG